MKRISLQKGIMIVTAMFIIAMAAYNDARALTPWTNLGTGTAETINSVFTLPSDSDVIFACGNNSLLLKSTDAGSNWSVLTAPVVGIDFNSIFFVDASRGYAVGESGTVIYTANGGTSWVSQSPGTTNDMNDVFFFSTSSGIIVGDNGIIRYTFNGGTSWISNSAGAYPENMLAVAGTGSSTAFICGENGVISLTTDGGDTWAVKQQGNKFYNLNDIAVASDGSVLSAGSDGNAVYSANFGATGFSPTVTGKSISFYACDITPEGDVFYMAGESGTVMRSMDKSLSWTDINISSGNDIRSIDFYSNSSGYASGSLGYIGLTESGGSSEALYSLNLTSPTAGDILNYSDTVQITWESRNVEEVSVYYRFADGDDWTLIFSGYNADSIDWVLPGDASETCKIRLVDEAGNASESVTTGYFKIFKPTMRLLSPNGGENWRNRANGAITWEGAQEDSVTIEYSTDNGASWITIQESLPATPSTYTWAVPVTPSEEAMVRVYDKENPENVDISNKKFSIHGVKLTSFQIGGEFLYESEQEISWKGAGLSALNILYSIDGGVSWETVAEDLPASDSSYTWVMPKTPSNDCRVKLIDPENSQYFDVSTNSFTITGVKLTSPVGGETWLSGTTENITWQNADVEKVSLKYTTDDGANWITIHSAVNAALGTYSWLIPKVENPSITLAISDMDNPTVIDTSATFYILNESGVVVTSPTLSSIWNGGTAYNITWASINVMNLDIEVSYNGGLTWNTVAESVAAVDKSYSWTVPTTTSSTECIIKLTDSENPGIFATSEGEFRIKNSLYQVPTYWTFVSQTGESAVILAPNDLEPKIGNVDLQSGDVIGVFYRNPDTASAGPYNNGGFSCAGRGVWQANGTNLSITVWGDNERTDLKDGFNMNEEYTLKVWDATEGIEYNVYAEYSGNSYFTDNGISVISVFTTHQIQSITLRKNVWTLFSTNLRPIDPDIKYMMSEIVESIDYMKNEEGEIYDPANGVNNINRYNQLHGYKIYMKDDAVLDISGVPAILNSNVIPLQSLKWHIIGYLPQVSIPVSHALTSLADSNLILVKNTKGEIYYPGYGINNLTPTENGVNGSLNPGEGYIICVANADSLHYPANGTSQPGDTLAPMVPYNYARKSGAVLQGGYEPTYFKPLAEATGSSFALVVECETLRDGDEIAAVSEEGFIFGASAIKNGKAVLTVWGDNSGTEKIDGASENENLQLICRKHSNQETKKLQITGITSVLNPNAEISELVYQENNPLKVSATEGVASVEDRDSKDGVSIYPNPADESCEISYTETNIDRIEIVNSAGMIVKTVIGTGSTASIDTSDLYVGSYIAVIHTGERVLSKSFLVMR
jgi:photosystem II stability/assembly factor-like uncharacterized protein